MNVTESGNLNVLLSYLTGRHADTYAGSVMGQALPTDADALEAAVALANRAHKALQCGWDGTLVRAAWPDPRHLLDVDADGWTLQHPISCRPNLLDCTVSRACEALTGPPAAPGRYAVDLDDAGALRIGEAIAGG